MEYLIHLSTFQTTNIMFAWQENTVLFSDFTDSTLVGFLFLSLSVSASLLALVSDITAQLEL